MKHPNWKRRKNCLFADDMILYIETLKTLTNKLLELINEFSKAAEYIINVKNQLHFYILK